MPDEKGAADRNIRIFMRSGMFKDHAGGDFKMGG